ncbi:MAG TPA: hypothetical protein ENJ09_12440 [Planctomycetes bacterium]|nr:hypothetical protein [Planctomycetota bacterium]
MRTPRLSFLLLTSLLAGSLGIARASRETPSPSTPQRQLHIQVEIPSASLRTYVDSAYDVVYGRCVGTGFDATATPWPCTVYRFEALRNSRGIVLGPIDVRVVGGANADIAVRCAKSPTLEIGQEYVLFLTENPDNPSYGILGLKDGTYRVNDEGQVSGLHAGQGEPVDRFLTRVSSIMIDTKETKEAK